MNDAVSYVSAVSDASGCRLRSVGSHYRKIKTPGTAMKQERFNEDVETKSTLSKQQKHQNMLS